MGISFLKHAELLKGNDLQATRHGQCQCRDIILISNKKGKEVSIPGHPWLFLCRFFVVILYRINI
jgi:hypothetical protein